MGSKSHEETVRVIIAGPRDYTDYLTLLMAVHLSRLDITEVVSGKARGVDAMGERWAEEHGVPVKPFPADWERWGKPAGMKRNKQMAEYAEGALLLWDGESRGTGGMFRLAMGR